MRDIFAILDKDGDGVICPSELGSMLYSLGRKTSTSLLRDFTNRVGLDSSTSALRNMVSHLGGPLEFPAFLTYITRLKSEISSCEDLIRAFTAFDENDSGYINFEDVKNCLMTTGPERMSEEQVDVALRNFVEKTGMNKGKVAYTKFLSSVVGNYQDSKVDS